MQKASFWEAPATLVGTIIGAGILGLPFVVAQVGILPGVCLIIILGSAAMIKNLMLAEVALRTKIRHQIAGYAGKYLGKTAYIITIISTLIGGFGALLVYTIGEGEVLKALLGGDAFTNSLIFFAAGAIVVFFGLRLIKVIELWMVLIFIVIISIILAVSSPVMDVSNFEYANLSKIFSSYGVVLFAFASAGAIIPLREILRKHEIKVRKAVIIGSVVPIIIYVLFSVVIVGVTGKNTTEIATIGLGKILGPYMVLFGNLFAFFTMGTSFLTIGLVLKEIFQYDIRWNKYWAWLAAMSVPIMLFLIGVKNFIATMEIAGSFTFGVTGVIVILTYWRAQQKGDRKPEFSMPKYKILGASLIVMFVAGLAYTVWDVIR